MTIADDITIMVLTHDEERNIARTFAKLTWAKNIVVIDSGSSDRTLEIVQTYPQSVILHRKFDDFASQCNFGLSQIKSDWVLSIDADYELSDGLIEEIALLDPGKSISGFRAAFIYRVYGRPLRATLYPQRTVLYRRTRANYRNEGHGHRVLIDGEVSRLRSKIYHDDRKPLSRWFKSQQRYTEVEVSYLLDGAGKNLSKVDRLRSMGWPAPMLVFFYTLIWKRCLLDGWPGWYYVMQRTLCELMFAIEIADRRLRQRGSRLDFAE